MPKNYNFNVGDVVWFKPALIGFMYEKRPYVIVEKNINGLGMVLCAILDSGNYEGCLSIASVDEFDKRRR